MAVEFRRNLPNFLETSRDVHQPDERPGLLISSFNNIVLFLVQKHVKNRGNPVYFLIFAENITKFGYFYVFLSSFSLIIVEFIIANHSSGVLPTFEIRICPVM